MQTELRGVSAVVAIGARRPIAVIGNRIDPGDHAISQALHEGELDLLIHSARAQADDGADVIQIDVRAAGVDEQNLLPTLVKAVAAAVDLPLAVAAQDPAALDAALSVCPGRPLVSGIGYDTVAIGELLPVAVRHGAAVMALAQAGGEAPAATCEELVEIGREMVRQCITAGIARHDVIIQLPTATLHGSDSGVRSLLEALAHISRVDAVSLAVALQAVSDGHPDQATIEAMISALAVRHGATCLVLDPQQGRRLASAANLLLGKEQP